MKDNQILDEEHHLFFQPVIGLLTDMQRHSFTLIND